METEPIAQTRMEPNHVTGPLARRAARPRLGWRISRVHPALAFIGFYAIALALSQVVIFLSPGPEVVSGGPSLLLMAAVAGAAAAWILALTVYARWLTRRLRGMVAHRPWRLGLVAMFLTLGGAAWLLAARAAFVSRLGFLTFEYQLPFYGATPAIHLLALAGIATVACLAAAARRG
ncbi:MAG TPA: hypothetical protein VGL40_02940 [Bacillota bacterium]